MESKSGSTAIGGANFLEVNGKILFEAKFSCMKPGIHSIHLHEKADYSSADGKSTGEH